MSETAKFVILAGTIKSPATPNHPKADNGHLGASRTAEPHVVELEPEEAEKMDPGCTKKPWAGHTLKPLEAWGAEQKGEAAKQAAVKAAEAEAAKKGGTK